MTVRLSWAISYLSIGKDGLSHFAPTDSEDREKPKKNTWLVSMSKTTLYFFSATGNSLAVALQLARALDIDEPISVPGSLVNEDPYIDAHGAKALGFVFPVQRATIPEMLRGFLQSMPIDPDCYYFAISTFSIFGSNEFWDIDELLVSQGAALNYAASIRMMGNVGPVRPSENTIQTRLELMERQVEEIATAITYRQENFFPRANKALGWAIRNFTDFRRKHIIFRIDKRCKGCGICAQVCPAQNIQLPQKGSEAMAPIRSNKCEACLACIHWCPAAAVSVSRRGHTSYHNPLVFPEQLNQTKPTASPNTTSGDALLIPQDDDMLRLNEDLATVLHNDLLTPIDIETWLDNNSANGTGSIPENLVKPAEPKKPGLENVEITEALSDLDR